MSRTSLSALWSRVRIFAWYLGDFLRHRGLSRSRRALKHLDDHLLRDIGLTRAEADAEAAIPAWIAPIHWRARNPEFSGPLPCQDA